MNAKFGFTLLEVLIVIGIMGLIAAMVWPMRGILDDSQRERATIEKMDAVVEAMLGHAQLKDPLDLSRTIGGYVGDMGAWPQLYEPGGTSGPGGLGGVRGSFVGERFQWTRPFQLVLNPNQESLGQPRGLWTRDELLADAKEKWKGPYLTQPVTRNPALGRHYAKNQAEYEALNITDRADFHLLQGGEQLADGWNRAFRFFITNNGETFCIVSLGPRGRGFPPGYVQVCDPNCLKNQGKIVRALERRDWAAVQAARALRSTSTQQLIFIAQDHTERIVRALIGKSPAGPNTGYTGDLLDWPELFNWVCSTTCQWAPNWVDPVFPGASKPFKYGQPRGLWGQGALAASRFGVGWRHAYLKAPDGRNEAELLLDAWNRPHHFFRVEEPVGVGGQVVEQFMILSGGEDGTFHFPPADAHGHPDPDYPATGGPAELAKRVRFMMEHYNADHALNRDNIVRIVRRNEWLPGFLTINTLSVNNVQNCAQTKCGLRGVVGALPGEGAWGPVLQCPDPVGDGVFSGGTWTLGIRPGETAAAFFFNDQTANPIVTGGRYLVCWVDPNGDDRPDPGESGRWKIFSIRAHPAHPANVDTVTLSALDFQPLP